MKILVTSIVCVLILITFIMTGFGQAIPRHSQAIVYLNGQPLNDLARAGIDISHGEYEWNTSFISDFSQAELDAIQAAGFEVEILIEDVQQFYSEQNNYPPVVKHAHRVTHVCGDSRRQVHYNEPVNFELGSMGGFYRLGEIDAQFARMELLYEHLISGGKSLGGIMTAQGRPLRYYKLTSNPNQDHPDRPKILHTALHHAREPISVTQMIFFVWYMLENYDTNPMVRYILDNCEIYLIPVVNPDGYFRNQNEAPNGGGMWRKNMRVVPPTNETGVDLNRNYSFGFGLNDEGSGANPNSDLYRGPAPFSEPETRAVKWLCERIPFQLALNYHSWGNLMLLPYGNPGVGRNNDLMQFYNVGMSLTEANGYQVGEPFITLYETNGTADDWMYGEQTTKNPIFAYTPEIGHSGHGFWPHITEIRPLCRENLHTNLISALSVLNSGKIINMTPEFMGGSEDRINIMVKKTGFLDGNFTVRLEPLNNGITSFQQQLQLAVNKNAANEVYFDIQLNSTLQFDDPITYAIHLDNGHYIESDTFTAFFKGPKQVVFEEEAILMDRWRANSGSSWSIDDFNYYAGVSSISDSPGVPYSYPSTSYLDLIEPIDLRAGNIKAAYLTFRSKWEIDPYFDYAQISGSTNGFAFTPLCGKFTQPHHVLSRKNLPLYTGFQNDWVKETIDISNYIGNNLFLQFSLIAELKPNYQHDYNGFHFDDLKVIIFYDTETSVTEKPGNREFASIFPNPSNGNFSIRYNDSKPSSSLPLHFEVFNSLGMTVYQKRMEDHLFNQEIHISNLPSGMYHYRLGNTQDGFQLGKLMIK